MTARQNPLSKFESWLQRIVEWPFSFFPSRLQPGDRSRVYLVVVSPNLMPPLRLSSVRLVNLPLAASKTQISGSLKNLKKF